MTNQALVPFNDRGGALAGMEQWQLMREQAGVFVKSGLLPAHIKSAEQAIVIMLKGRELGLPPLYALSTISVLGGKPVVAAEVMAALAYRDHGDQALRIVRSDENECAIEYRRRGWSAAQSYTFTIEDARRAGLLGSQVWQKYPAAMLRARCISAVARMAFPDSIGGLYTPEELGAAVQVVEDQVLPDYAQMEAPSPVTVREESQVQQQSSQVQQQPPQRPAAPTPATIVGLCTQDQVNTLTNLAAKLLNLTGEVYELPAEPISVEAGRRVNAELTRRIAAVEQAPPQGHAGDPLPSEAQTPDPLAAPATPDQRKRLIGLLTALKQPATIADDLTAGAAATQIVALVRQFNAQPRGVSR